MSFVHDWELMYTDSKNDEDLVDQVSIDFRNKRYGLDIDANSCVTDGCDEEGNEIYSHYVSRALFDLVIESLDSKGIKKIDF